MIPYFHPVTVFVTVQKPVFQAQFVWMFMIYIHAEFHIHNSSDLLVIDVKLKVSANFRVASNFFYINKKLP